MKGGKKGNPKGVTGNPKGRPKGIPNKVTSQVKQIFADIFENNKDKIQSDIDALESKERLQFLVALLPYVVPKKAPEENPIRVTAPQVKVLGVSTDELEDLLGTSQEAQVVTDED